MAQQGDNQNASKQVAIPPWLKVKTGKASLTRKTRSMLRDCNVHTVCEAAMCPNIGECFCAGTATFMLLGDTCTRDCRFCAVRHGTPQPPDPAEPAHVAEAAVRLGLEYVVLTCVTRDDLPDGGAEHFVATIEALRQRIPDVRIEVLPSDFGGAPEPLARVLEARPTVYNHNIETVRRLQKLARPQAAYERSLGVLRRASEIGDGIPVKSGLMVGLGESAEEIREALGDLADAGCSIVTIGQYLQPSPHHLPVDRYVTPDEFVQYETWGRELGIAQMVSGAFVRSSYRAGEACPDAD